MLWDATNPRKYRVFHVPPVVYVDIPPLVHCCALSVPIKKGLCCHGVQDFGQLPGILYQIPENKKAAALLLSPLFAVCYSSGASAGFTSLTACSASVSAFSIRL